MDPWLPAALIGVSLLVWQGWRMARRMALDDAYPPDQFLADCIRVLAVADGDGRLTLPDAVARNGEGTVRFSDDDMALARLRACNRPGRLLRAATRPHHYACGDVVAEARQVWRDGRWTTTYRLRPYRYDDAHVDWQAITLSIASDPPPG